jgi:hypothetical protein
MDHQMQKLFYFCLKAHGFLCHGRFLWLCLMLTGFLSGRDAVGQRMSATASCRNASREFSET